MGQGGNVLASLAERRESNPHHVEAVVQVVPKRPSRTSVVRSLLVAVITRTFTRTEWLLPTGRTSCSPSTRRSLACMLGPMSPISSRKTDPPSPDSKSPRRAAIAPVNAPRTCPKSSLSKRPSANPAQLIATKGPAARGPLKWSARATISFPVPLSPVMSTGLLFGETRAINLKTSIIHGLTPTMLLRRYRSRGDSSGPRPSRTILRRSSARRTVSSNSSSRTGLLT